MDSHDLTPKQLEIITNKIRAMFPFIETLKRRTLERGWPEEDELFIAIRRSHDSIQNLLTALHTLSHGQREQFKPDYKQNGYTSGMP